MNNAASNHRASIGQHFLGTISKWAAGIPLSSMWAVFIEIPPGVKQWLEKFKAESYDGNDWKGLSTRMFEHLNKPAYNNVDINTKFAHGCVFARGVTIPGETQHVVNISTKTSGLLFPDVLGGRSNRNIISISCLETNASYVDSVLRPWSIVASYAGLISRNDAENIKGKITAYYYSKTSIGGDRGRGLGPGIRKAFIIEDVVPVSIESASSNQRFGDSLQEKDVAFYFSRYSIANTEAEIYLSMDISEGIQMTGLKVNIG